MKLYYTPGACSLSPHIVAKEAGLAIELQLVDLATKKAADGRDFASINPKGSVPALELDDGSVLTEGPAIVQYLADRNPGAQLAPAAGTMSRYRLQEMLGFINSEIHKTFSPLFRPGLPPSARAETVEQLYSRYELIDRWWLTDRNYLVDNHFTAADAYLFTVTNWASMLKVDLSRYSHVLAFQGRIAARPAVQAALRAEGLVR